MATKKKATAALRGGAKARAQAKGRSVKTSEQAFSNQTIQVLIICFTFLSFVFSVLAFWRYG